MKLPSISDYNKMVTDEILSTIKIDKDSFVKYGIKKVSCVVRLSEFSAPTIVCSLEVVNNKGIAGFDILLVLSDAHDNMLEITKGFATLDGIEKGKSKTMYQEIFLPDGIDLHEVEKMTLSAENSILTPESIKEGK